MLNSLLSSIYSGKGQNSLAVMREGNGLPHPGQIPPVLGKHSYIREWNQGRLGVGPFSRAISPPRASIHSVINAMPSMISIGYAVEENYCLCRLKASWHRQCSHPQQGAQGSYSACPMAKTLPGHWCFHHWDRSGWLQQQQGFRMVSFPVFSLLQSLGSSHRHPVPLSFNSPPPLNQQSNIAWCYNRNDIITSATLEMMLCVVY